MAHFAHINKDGIVDQVIVIEQEVLNEGHWGNPDEWVQTSYNANSGDYKREGMTKEESLSLKTVGSESDIKARNRKHYAGKGFTYDKALDVFIPPQPYPSWILDKVKFTWSAPKKYPTDGKAYLWDESSLTWKEYVTP